MNILALNPPFLPRYSRESRSPAVTKSGTLYYPMWLAYAVGYLEKHGHLVKFIDAPGAGKSLDDVVAEAAAFRPSMAVLDTSTPSIYSDIKAAAALKQAVPSLFVVMVGVHVSALPEGTLSDAAGAVDAVAVGEYDATLVELALKLEKAVDSIEEQLRTIQGLAFKSPVSGTIIRNDPRDFLDNLDDFPYVSSVYRRHLDIQPYFYGHSRHPLIVLVSGRGCPFRCTYCVVPQTLQGHRYRKRSIESLVGEFRYIHQHFGGVREIMIEDDTFTADKKRCREFSYALIHERLTSIPWSANSRADVDYDTMKIMRKAGCRLFCVGFESGCQEILDNINKSLTLDRIHAFMTDARRAGILVHGCFMVGNRGETSQTLEMTLQFALKLNPDTAQFYPIMVYPGTSDYEYFQEKGWIVTKDFRKWLTEDGLHSSVVSNPDLTYEALVAFCDRARREFYLRPAYIASKVVQAITRPSEAKRIFKAGFTLFKHLVTPSLKVQNKP
jgi:anaerobic magnesium-protoporphyrin IX monomethyl ester cyclase